MKRMCVALFSLILIGCVGQLDETVGPSNSVANSLGFSGQDQENGPEQLDLIPQEIFQQMLSGDGFVGNFGLAWQQDEVVVSFYGGSTEVLELIEKTANEWTTNSNSLRFSFRDGSGNFNRWSPNDRISNNDIRISFDRRGYWSTVGRLALNVEPSQPTMNLASLGRKLLPYAPAGASEAWRKSYERNVILHEFGHAIGISHEHFHSSCQSSLKLDRIVANLMGPPNNWSERQAKFNVDADVYFSEMRRFITRTFPTTDPSFSTSQSSDNRSVMLYRFAPSAYENSSPCRPANASGFAHGLSDDDLAAASAMYPGS